MRSKLILHQILLPQRNFCIPRKNQLKTIWCKDYLPKNGAFYGNQEIPPGDGILQVPSPNRLQQKKISRNTYSNIHVVSVSYCWLPVYFLFIWVTYNFRIISRLKKKSAIGSLNSGILVPLPISAALLFMLSLAPLFDLEAPSIYIEAIELLLMIILTYFLWKNLPKGLFFFGLCLSSCF
jgi:hypothetical protein